MILGIDPGLDTTGYGALVMQLGKLRVLEAGVVRSEWTFLALSAVRGSVRTLKAGEYEVPRDAGTLVLTDGLWRHHAPLASSRRLRAVVDAASLDEWTAQRLAEPVSGVATVVFHSVVEEYVDEAVHARFRRVLADASARATGKAPLAWLRLEPVSALRAHAVRLAVWTGGEERVLALCRAHGTGVRAPGPPP